MSIFSLSVWFFPASGKKLKRQSITADKPAFVLAKVHAMEDGQGDRILLPEAILPEPVSAERELI
jgi:hypothetical protein